MTAIDPESLSVHTGDPTEHTKVVKYPIDTLKIGQYLFVPGADIRKMSSMVSYATKFRKGCTMKKFTCRTIEKDGIRGVAIYRVKHPVFDTEEFIQDAYGSSGPVSSA